MKLSELRRLAIRKQLRVHFTLNGIDCLISEAGLAQVPTLKDVPNFNLEEMLTEVQTFGIEAVATEKPEKPRQTSRDQVEKMIAALSPAMVAAGADHDD